MAAEEQRVTLRGKASLAKLDEHDAVLQIEPLRPGGKRIVGEWMTSNIRAIAEALFCDEDGPPPSDRLDWLCADFEDFLARLASARLTYRACVLTIAVLGPVLVGSPFTRYRDLSLGRRIEALEKLERSPLSMVILGIKMLASIVYFEHPDAADEIGFDAECRGRP